MQFWSAVTTGTLVTACAAVILVANYDKPPHHQPTPAAISAVTAADIDWHYESAFGFLEQPASRLGITSPACANTHQPDPTSGEADSVCTPDKKARFARATASADTFAQSYWAIVERHLKSAEFQAAHDGYRECLRNNNVTDEYVLRLSDPSANHWRGGQTTSAEVWSTTLTAAHTTCSAPFQQAIVDVHQASRAEFDQKFEIPARRSLRQALAEAPDRP